MLRAIVLGSVAGIFFAQVGWAAQASFQPRPRFSYAIKFVCGELQEDGEVVVGRYATAINVHNPSLGDEILPFRKKFVRALPFQTAGEVTEFEPTRLRANHAFEIDCPEILSKFQPPTGGTLDFVKGFVVILTPAELDITAVYTARPGPEQGVSTIDVETVQPRRIIPKVQITPVPVPDRP